MPGACCGACTRWMLVLRCTWLATCTITSIVRIITAAAATAAVSTLRSCITSILHAASSNGFGVRLHRSSCQCSDVGRLPLATMHSSWLRAPESCRAHCSSTWRECCTTRLCISDRRMWSRCTHNAECILQRNRCWRHCKEAHRRWPTLCSAAMHATHALQQTEVAAATAAMPCQQCLRNLHNRCNELQRSCSTPKNAMLRCCLAGVCRAPWPQ